MVLMSTLLNNIKELVNQYVYTKEETRENFDDFVDNSIRYVNGNFIINEGYSISNLFQPAFDGTTTVIQEYNNSNANTQSNGVATFKGCVIADGWDNTGLWELSVDIAYLSGLRYTGLILLTDADEPFTGWGIKNWEGPVTGTPSISDGNGGAITSTNYTKTPNTTLTDLPSGKQIIENPTVDWYTLHIRKTSLTTLEVWKNNDIDNKVTYEWAELSDVPRCTIGGRTNAVYPSSYGSVYMRNLVVTQNWEEFYPLIVDFTKWSGTQPIYSNFILPYNHEIIITFKSTPNIQIACSDTSNNWIYAQNIGFENNNTFSYRSSTNSVLSKNPSVTRNNDSVYKIVCYENMISYYVNDIFIHSTPTYDTLNITRKIRIYDNADSIKTLTVKKVV